MCLRQILQINPSSSTQVQDHDHPIPNKPQPNNSNHVHHRHRRLLHRHRPRNPPRPPRPSPSESRIGTIIALTRSSNTPSPAPSPLTHLASSHPNLQIRPVDYTSIPSLTTGLTGAHTVISCIVSPTDFGTPQLNLLSAARAAGVRRFAPSEFAPPGFEGLALYKGKADVWDACVIAAQEPGGMEVARFTCGLLMELLGVGCPEERRAEALAGLTKHFSFIWDVGNMKAEIPGDGDAEVTFTRAGDVGRCVAAACLMPEGQWGGEMGLAGETVRMVDVVGMTERVRGREMEVRFVGVEELEGRVRDTRAVMEEKEGDLGARMGHFRAEGLLAMAKGGG